MFRNLLDLVMQFLAGLGGLWYGHRAVISNFPIVGSAYGLVTLHERIHVNFAIEAVEKGLSECSLLTPVIKYPILCGYLFGSL